MNTERNVTFKHTKELGFVLLIRVPEQDEIFHGHFVDFPGSYHVEGATVEKCITNAKEVLLNFLEECPEGVEEPTEVAEFERNSKHNISNEIVRVINVEITTTEHSRISIVE